MFVRRAILFGIFLSFLIVSASALDGYYIHCNVDGARVCVGDKVIGEIQDHVLWVPWTYGNDFPFMTISEPGYLDIWEKLEQPWPGMPEHRYYRLQPQDPRVVMYDGDIRILVQPSALNYVYIRDLSPGSDGNWEFYGDYYGSEFTVHYVPYGKKEVMIKRTNWEDVSQEVYVQANTEVDMYYEMVRTDYAENPSDVLSTEFTQHERTAAKEQSILVIETPTPEPVEQVTVTPAPTVEDTVTPTEEIPEEEKPFNTLGALILVCFVGMFIGGGWYMFNRIQLV